MLLAHGGQGPLRRQRQPQHRHGDRHRGGQGDRDDRHGDRPQGPAGQHAQLAGALARRVDALRRQRQHQQPGRRERQGARRQHAAGLHPDRLVSDLGPALARRQDDLRGQRQGGLVEGQPRRPATRSPTAGGHDPRVHRRALPGDALDHPDARPRSRWPPTRKTVYECSPLQAGRPDRRDRPGARAGQPDPGARSATRRRSSTASTSSRRTAPTTRSSATCPRATATRTSASSPRRSRPTTTPWPASSCCSTTSTSRARSAPTATNGRWGPTPPISSSGSGRSATAATAACPYPVGGRRLDDRPAGRRLPLGPGRREGGQLSQLRRVRRERHDARRPRHDRASRPCEGHFDPMFRSFDMDYPDAEARRPLPRGAGRVREGGRDAPADRSCGCPTTTPPARRPASRRATACVADNDLALGRVVEGLSKSRFWKQMAIFVVEDDAQNGSDHVDAHRTVALAISPYIKRHSVDSTMYSTSSMLRTMELILGLEPMSQFDAAARPMFNAVHAPRPTSRPYAHRPARVDLNARNTRDAPVAEVSQRARTSRSRTAPTTCSSTRSSGRPSRGPTRPCPRRSARRSSSPGPGTGDRRLSRSDDDGDIWSAPGDASRSRPVQRAGPDGANPRVRRPSC